MAGALGGILVGNNIARLTAGIAAATVGWKPLERRGLELGTEPATGFAAASGKTRPVLRGSLDGVAVAVRLVSDFVHYAHTKVTATPAAGVEVTVGVHPNPAGLFGKIRGWLGQDIVIGDPTFDDAFLITGQPPGAAAALLTPARRERNVARAASHLAGFTYERNEVVVLLVGVVTDPEILGVALDLARDAADFAG
jgi:hypothetical protein